MNIFIVIVIYCVKYFESSTVKSLLLPDSKGNINLKALLYDNSPDPQQIGREDSEKYIYVHNPLNGGLAGAYNHALSMIDDQDSWLLLFDQDSQLPCDFITSLIETIDGIQDESIVAVAPHVLCNNKPISPCKVRFAGRLVGVSEKIREASDLELMAINSGMAVRASFMKQIGGFNQDFWLDHLDHWLCHMIYLSKKKIYISSEIVDHDLSVANYNNVSEHRALNILNSEMLFYRKYKPWYERSIYFFRLICRGVKQYTTVKNTQIARNTLSALWRFVISR